MTSAARAPCSCSAPRRCWTAPPRTSRSSQKYGVPYELLDVDGCVRVEPALGLVREKIAGGLRLPGDETGDCFKFTNALAAVCRQQGVEFRNGTRIDGILTEARQGHRRRHRQGHRHRRRLRHGARQLLAAAAAQDRDRPAGLPGQGLLAHHPDHRSCRRSGIDGHGRDPQGGDHPARRPDPGRRHGRARRLQHEAAASAPRHARACRHRPLPQGRRRRQGQLLVRAAADDAGRPAGDRPRALRQSLPQHRPRYLGLDHGLRLRPGARRPDLGPARPRSRSSELSLARYRQAA